MTAPDRLVEHDPRIPVVLDLVKRNFAFMEGRIDPPSSMYRMTEASIADHLVKGEAWVMGDPVYACIFLTPKPDALYVGKLAVDAGERGAGHAHTLIDLAEARAKALSLPALELETRIELHENHAAFARMGFVKTAEAAHDGYTRPTFIIMRKPL